MTDVHDQKTRSYNMRQIKNKDTKPELIVRKFLFSKGFRYKLHDRSLPGKPDLVFPKYRTVVFVHGCFWHGHMGCKYFVIPETRKDWWTEKINRNREVDFKNAKRLKKLGWKIIVVFECQLKKTKMSATLHKVVLGLRGRQDQKGLAEW